VITAVLVWTGDVVSDATPLQVVAIFGIGGARGTAAINLAQDACLMALSEAAAALLDAVLQNTSGRRARPDRARAIAERAVIAGGG